VTASDESSFSACCTMHHVLTTLENVKELSLVIGRVTTGNALDALPLGKHDCQSELSLPRQPSTRVV